MVEEQARVNDQETKKDSAPIAVLNDRFRKSGNGIVITDGAQELGDNLGLFSKVAMFNEFTEENDPYGEHDFGMIVARGHELLFKIDYYDRDLVHHSPDAADPSVTTRVLTIMLADEY